MPWASNQGFFFFFNCNEWPAAPWRICLLYSYTGCHGRRVPDVGCVSPARRKLAKAAKRRAFLANFSQRAGSRSRRLVHYAASGAVRCAGEVGCCWATEKWRPPAFAIANSCFRIRILPVALQLVHVVLVGDAVFFWCSNLPLSLETLENTRQILS